MDQSTQVQAAKTNSARGSGDEAVDRIRPWPAPGSEKENLLEGPGKTKENEVKKSGPPRSLHLPGSPNHQRRMHSHGNYSESIRSSRAVETHSRSIPRTEGHNPVRA